MKLSYSYVLAFGACLLLIYQCSPTRDRKLNRAWHTMTGHYNVYFNGEQKLLEITQNLEKGHVNDFTKVLDVFPYGDEAAAKAATAQLDEVMKKASKSIQEHTVGKYTDDSYLLIAKSHFFKRDFYASIEALQYINNRYKDGGLKPIATTWIAKCYLGMKKPDESEAIINNCLSEFGPKVVKGVVIKPTLKERFFPKYPDAYMKEMYATAAFIFIKQEKYVTAAKHLEDALKFTKTKTEKIRFRYILGQLYLSMDSIDKANAYFKSILGMNAPYDFEFNASINVARAYNPSDKSAVKKVRRALKRMLADEKNDGMYDQIHFELAKLEQKQNNISEAIKQYNLSIQKSTKNKNQKALAYLALGNIYLEMPDYKLAQAYYDSTANTLNSDFKDYEKIKAKKELLSELIEYKLEIEAQDSLQRIALLSPEETEKKIDQWIVASKQEADRKAKIEQMRKENAEKAGTKPDMGIAQTSMDGSGSQWYFYNKNTIINGQAEFFSMKKWGRRVNEDYWRYSKKEKIQAIDNKGDKTSPDGKVEAGKPTFESEVEQASNKKDSTTQKANSRKAWLADVPYTAEALEKSNSKIKDAYYGMGVLYDEKLLDTKEAIRTFDTLMERFPQSSYEPELLYREVKLYQRLKDQPKADYITATLITKYPESPYARILQKKEITSTADESNAEINALYKQAYAAYQQNQFTEVFSIHEQVVKNYPGNAMMAKFDLLRALAIGKTQSKETFIAELRDLAKEYPKTDVGNYAEQTIQVLTAPKSSEINPAKAAESTGFTMDESSPQYFVFATKIEKFDNNEALSVFNRFNDEYVSNEKLRVNNILGNDGYQLIYVVQFPNMQTAISYMQSVEKYEIVSDQLKFKGAYIQFVISVTNFRKVLKEQKIEAYNTYFSDYYKKMKKP